MAGDAPRGRIVIPSAPPPAPVPTSAVRGREIPVPRCRLAVAVVALLAVASACQAEEWARKADLLRLPEPGVPLGSVPENATVPLIDDRTRDAARGPSPATLDDFVALAMQNHPRLRAAQAAVEAARGKAVQARLYPNPVIAGFSPQIAGDQSQWSGTVAQDLVTGGKLKLAQQAALREVQKTEYDLIRARFDVLLEVRQGFYALLVSQRRVEIYRLLLDIAKRSYEIGAQLAAAGEGTKADVLFWSIERDRAEVRLLNAAVFIETGRRQLATAIGLPRADIGKLEGDLFRRLPNFDLKTLQEAVVRANALPRAQEADVARAQWALERAVVQPIANINVMGGYQRQVGIPAMDQGLVQVMMAVPLFDRNQGNIRSARADIASSRANLRTIELDLATKAAQTIAAYRTSQRLVEWYETYILPKARETVQLTQTLYARGEVTFLSLLQAQRILTETELAFVESQAERWNGAVTIADLLQLEAFPLGLDAPGAIDSNAADSELNPAPIAPPAAAPAIPAQNVPAPAAPAGAAPMVPAPAVVPPANPAAAPARLPVPPAAAPARPLPAQ
jgi:cobalt-zinc-cadmium efflux system outer membrane protein